MDDSSVQSDSLGCSAWMVTNVVGNSTERETIICFCFSSHYQSKICDLYFQIFLYRGIKDNLHELIINLMKFGIQQTHVEKFQFHLGCLYLYKVLYFSNIWRTIWLYTIRGHRECFEFFALAMRGGAKERCTSTNSVEDNTQPHWKQLHFSSPSWY